MDVDAEQVAAGQAGVVVLLELRAVLVGAGAVHVPEEPRWRLGVPEVGGDLPGGPRASVEEPPLDESGSLRKAVPPPGTDTAGGSAAATDSRSLGPSGRPSSLSCSEPSSR
jgi:hypothetical protein